MKIKLLLSITIFTLTFCLSCQEYQPYLDDVIKRLDAGPVPKVVTSYPRNGGRDVPVETYISLTFSEEMDTETLSNKIVLKLGEDDVQGEVVWLDNKTLHFKPSEYLKLDKIYTLSVKEGAKTLEYADMNYDYTLVFLTAGQYDETAPFVVSTTPEDNSISVAVPTYIAINFSELMMIEETKESFKITDVNGYIIAGTFTWQGTQMLFKPTNELSFSTIYYVSLATTAKDLAGNPLVTNTEISFTTRSDRDTELPKVISTYPVNNAANVSVNQNITLTFSEIMDQSSTQNAFTLTDVSNKEIEGIFLWKGNSVIFTAVNGLKLSNKYTISVSPNAKDISGNSLSVTYKYTFMTEGTYSEIEVPDVSNFQLVNTSTGALLTWENPTTEFAGVKILRKKNNAAKTPTDGTLVYTGTGTTFDDEIADRTTMYFYSIYVFNASMLFSNGVDTVYIPDISSPSDVTDLTTIPATDKVTLTWTNPTEDDFAGMKICRQENDCSGIDSSCTPIYTAGINETSWVDTTKVKGTAYCYKIYSFDTSGNYSEGAIITAPALNRGDYIWDWTAGGSGDDIVYDIDIDNQGNIYLAGYFKSLTIDFGGGIRTNAGDNDIFIVKLDSNGNYLWDRTIGGSMSDMGYGISIDSQNNIYIAGRFESSDINFGGGNRTSSGLYDIFIVKFNSNGDYIWDKKIGGTNHDVGYELICYGDYIYLIGYYMSSPINFGGGNRNALESYDIFLLKIKNDGSYVWDYTRPDSGGGYDSCSGLNLDKLNNIYIAGQFGGTGSFNINFGGGARTSVNDYDIFIAKFDNNGIYQWDYTKGGNGLDRAYRIYSDSNGDVYTCGYFNSTNINFGGGTRVNAGSGTYDLYLLKLSSNGTYLWDYTKGSIGNDTAYDVVIDSLNNVYICGGYYGNVDFGGSARNAVHSDVYIVMLDSNGTYLWDYTVGGDDYDAAGNIVLDNSGSIYIRGNFKSSSIDFGGGARTNASAGTYDIFVVKLAQ